MLESLTLIDATILQFSFLVRRNDQFLFVFIS